MNKRQKDDFNRDIEFSVNIEMSENDTTLLNTTTQNFFQIIAILSTFSNFVYSNY